METGNWKQWDNFTDADLKLHLKRFDGTLPEMESTKQLVKLISEEYHESMRVLDVGCNIGHYLLGLRKKFPEMSYTGVDAYKQFIDVAKKQFENDKNAKFEIKDIFKEISPENPYDIVFCCNVLLHLPDFRTPIKNLLASTKKVCFIRTLIGERTTLVTTPIVDEYDENGIPLEHYFHNTWNKDYIINYINTLGWNTELIPDEFNPESIQGEHEKAKKNDETFSGTKIINEKQVVDNIILNFAWLKITPK